MSDGNGHTGAPLPHLAVGGRRAREGNRHIVTPEGTPMANLLLALAQKCGVEQEKFGVSQGSSGDLIRQRTDRCSSTRQRFPVAGS